MQFLPSSGRVDTAIWMHYMDTKRMEKKLDGNYTRIVPAILKMSGKPHPSKQQLCGHLPRIIKTIKVIRTRHEGHCWRSNDELISDVLLWTLSHKRAKAGWPTRTYIQQLCQVRDVILKTCRMQWAIGKGSDRGTGISVLIARPDDVYIYI